MITELWENEHDFSYLSDHYLYDNIVNSDINMATAAIRAQKAKFRFPKQDPQAPDIVDKRSDKQKMSDILRVWSQVLTREETNIWNEVSQRDLSRDISLKSGLRTPKCVIDREIKMFRQAPGKRAAMLKSLENLPDEFQATPISQPQVNDSPNILETNQTPLLLPEESPVISQLDTAFISNFSDLIAKIQFDKPYENNVQLNADYITLKNDCTRQVLNFKIQCNNTIKLQTIF